MSFPMGETVATPGVLERVPRPEILKALSRHAQGDWGVVCQEDRRRNDLALKQGWVLHSAYLAASGVKFWIITEADRSATTVLLPEEY